MCLQPPQANVTSDKTKQKGKRSKRGLKVKKLEVTRNGAILPDNISLSNHMTSTRISKKEYSDRCESLRKNCSKSVECNAHTSLKNLRKISKGLSEILAQTDVLRKQLQFSPRFILVSLTLRNLPTHPPLSKCSLNKEFGDNFLLLWRGWGFTYVICNIV